MKNISLGVLFLFLLVIIVHTQKDDTLQICLHRVNNKDNNHKCLVYALNNNNQPFYIEVSRS